MTQSTQKRYWQEKEFLIWLEMRRRCRVPHHRDYKHYGARGIDVCERWNCYAAFIEDMGHKPSPSHSLDRINNDLGYFKDNCRWATRAEQARNMRSNVMLTFNGETKCLKDWARSLGICHNALRHRVNNWPLSEALTKPRNPGRPFPNTAPNPPPRGTKQ